MHIHIASIRTIDGSFRYGYVREENITKAYAIVKSYLQEGEMLSDCTKMPEERLHLYPLAAQNEMS